MTDTDDKTPQEWRAALLEAALPHIAFDGWTWPALARGAKDLGLSESFPQLAFGSRIQDVVDFYLARVDTAMVEGMRAPEVQSMKIREKVTHAVLLRLEHGNQHKEAASRLVGYLAQRPHLSARYTWRAADAVWRSLGDKSTDYNWYTKRAILSGVYSSTLLVWVGDDSTDMSKTRRFLDRRIANVMQFEKVKAQVLKANGKLPSLTRFAGRLRYPRAR